jgi:hypothetical protein
MGEWAGPGPIAASLWTACSLPRCPRTKDVSLAAFNGIVDANIFPQSDKPFFVSLLLMTLALQGCSGFLPAYHDVVFVRSRNHFPTLASLMVSKRINNENRM